MKIYLSNSKGRIDASSITFFDMETTTKEPATAEILTGYFRTVDAQTRLQMDELHVKMKPRKYVKESYPFHKISEEEANSYPEKIVMMREIFRYLSRHEDSLLICHANYMTFGVKGYFDWQVIKTECLYLDILHHFNDFFGKREVYSTHTMAKERKLPVSKYSLDVLAGFIGFNFSHHNAEQDVNATEALFWWLIDNGNSLLDLMEE